MNNPERLVALVDDLVSSESETSCTEFKHNNFDPERIGTLISAISNAARLNNEPFGHVVWGVADETQEIVGTNFRFEKEKANGQPLEFWLAKQVSPDLHFTFKEVNHSKGRLVILEIPAAAQVSTKFKNIAYVRIGSATPKLSDYPDREASLMARLRPFVWEHGVAKQFVETREVIQLLDVASYFYLTELPVPGSDEEIAAILAHDKLIAKDVGSRWNILNLGAVLFGKNLTSFDGIARKAVRVIIYNGNTRTAEAADVTGTKGYALAFDGVIDYVNKRLPHHEQITRSLRVRKPIYPEIAIRELIANALVHQDMTIGGTGPVIEIFNDRVEITNPGIPLIETDRFIDLPPRSRNESLASLMRRVGVCEEQGSGIDKVIDAIEEAQLPAPDFRAEGNSLKAIVFNRRSFGQMTTEERVRGCYQHAVLKYVNTHEGFTNSTLRHRFGVAEKNASQISRVIKLTTEMGFIKPSDNWTSRAGTYLPIWA